jgi:hypothetical protein
MLPDILRERPLMFWAAVFMLIPLGALILPLDWANTGQTTFINADQGRLDAFAPRVVEVDRALRESESVEVATSEWRAIRPYLQARRLTRAGPMSQNDVQRAVDMFRRRNRRIAGESTPGSKRAVRSLWRETFADTFPRLEPDRIETVLKRLRRQIETRLRRVEPNATDEQAS